MRTTDRLPINSGLGVCVVKCDDNAPCGLPTIHLTAEQAQAIGYGTYSGQYHLNGDRTDHLAFPGHML